MINNKTANNKLIELAKNNNEEAFNMLLFRWNGVLSMICASYLKSASKFGINFQELKGVAQFSLYNSLKYYDKNKSNFKTYLNLIINQALTKYIKKYEIRYCELLSCLSFDDIVYENSIMQLDEIIGDPESSIVNWYNNNEQFDYFKDLNEEILSKEDKNIIYLKASGYTYHEASEKLKISKTRTDFALKKIKKIMRK
ncbi:MAG: hypothetical protein J1F32_05330 [Erysipelotrichales bacterium]|nr:hypothetical protein [Erysipelotrichales bacterium]